MINLKKYEGVLKLDESHPKITEKIQDYKIEYLEKQVINNQDKIMTALDNLEKEYRNQQDKRNKEHEETQLKLKEHDLEIQQINSRFTKMDASLRVIITTVIAQLLILITQVLLPHLFH